MPIDGRLNLFENMPAWNLNFGLLSADGACHLHHVLIPGSISFKSVAVLISQSGSTQAGSSVLLTLRFGLYSINGASLSLANSASNAFTLSSNVASWLTLATSAAQDITPGNWFFYLQSHTANSGGVSLYCNSRSNFVIDAADLYVGPFFRGYTSTGTGSVPPNSIATSALTKEGASTTAVTYNQPYILIAA